jgi:hypothetical protein
MHKSRDGQPAAALPSQGLLAIAQQSAAKTGLTLKVGTRISDIPLAFRLIWAIESICIMHVNFSCLSVHQLAIAPCALAHQPSEVHSTFIIKGL